MTRRTPYHFIISLCLALLVSACNLNSSDVVQETIAGTGAVTSTGLPSRTPNTTSGAPTPLPLTALAPTLSRPTSIVSVPQTAVLPPQATNTTLPVSIVILSPIPGNVVAGNVQVLGAATHPQFLQYQVEYGPDPNPGQLWYPATNPVQQPVLNGLLGVWNTAATQDGLYQLRLRVYLRDGTTLSTVVGNVRVQNRQPTPIPSATQNVPRPIAAFTQDVASGQVPLTVRFTNQSSGTITSYSWNFGDGQSSTEASPVHTFNSPGLYNVTLTVTGPGGSSNVSRQISVQSQTPPSAAFTQDVTSGTAPLTVRFTNQSTGTINSVLWNFSDGTTSAENHPVHVFNVPGTYNVFLTVTGPGGVASATRQIVVDAPAPTATFTPTATTEPPTATATSTETPTTEPPTATMTETPTETTAPAPVASFSVDVSSGPAPLTVNFIDASTGTIDAYEWDFDGGGVDSTTPGNQQFIYQTEGTFTATLIVYSGGIPSQPYTVNITVEPPASVPNVVDSVNIITLPPNPQPLQDTYTQGTQQLERVATAFSIAGDELLTTPGVLTPFSQPGNYNLGANGGLQPLVDHYSANPGASFGRSSTGVNTGLTANALVNEPSSHPDCGGQSPLQCELNANKPAVILISVGYYDALNNTDPAAFRNTLNQIIDTATSNGTIPVLLTVATTGGADPEAVNRINEQILAAGTERQIPVLNTGRVLNGLTQDVSPNGAGYLDDASTYKVNALNLHILQILDSVLDTAAPGLVP